MRNGERGQAVLETAIFLPLFIVLLFGVIWVAPAAVQYERTASAVRYAGLISQRNGQYSNLSSYAIYAELASPTLPNIACTTPSTDPLSDAAPTYTSSKTVTASQPFWSPLNTSSATCLYAGYWGIAAGGTWLENDMILSTQEPAVYSRLAIPSALSHVIPGGTTFITSTAQWFYKPVGIDAILACYPGFEKLVSSGLSWATDTSTSGLQPVALPNSVPASTEYNQGYYTVNASCL